MQCSSTHLNAVVPIQPSGEPNGGTTLQGSKHLSSRPQLNGWDLPFVQLDSEKPLISQKCRMERPRLQVMGCRKVNC